MIWPHNLFFYNKFSQLGNIVRDFDFEWTRHRSLKTGTKRDLPPKSEDMVFLLTHLCEIDPVFSRISLKKALRFSFRGKNNKEAAPGYTFGFVVAQTIKQLLKTKQNQQPRLACTWIQSPENDNENQKVSSASASRDQPRKPVQYTVYMLQFHFYHILYYILRNLY